jgi:N utilization substance protein B
MISRRRTREYLLQLLYARASLPTVFSRDIFCDSYYEDTDMSIIDIAYVDLLEWLIIKHERELLDIIFALAPKFELETMPHIHILILMIALTEMLFVTTETIPPSVSTNEAIELAKRFTDEQWKWFVNGALSTFLKDKDKILNNKIVGKYTLF